MRGVTTTMIAVEISRFDEGARGTGRLARRGGSGGWHGAGKDGACSGHWEARRR